MARLYKRAEYIGLIKTAACLLQHMRIKQAIAALNFIPGSFRGGQVNPEWLKNTELMKQLSTPGTNLVKNIKTHFGKSGNLGAYRDMVATLGAYGKANGFTNTIAHTNML